MKKITKTILIAIFSVISGLNNIANAQNIQGYSDATIDGRGFSYNVQLSITPIENNEVTHAGGWIVKLISVNPDSKGYYHKGKTDRYFSCSELGSICNPSKFDQVLVKVKYQCENNAEKLIVFYGIDREERIVVRQKSNTNCSIELEFVKVRNIADDPIYHKRVKEIEYPEQNTSTNISNTSSSSSNNPAAQSVKSKDAYINGQINTTSSGSSNSTSSTETTKDVNSSSTTPSENNPLDNYNNPSSTKSAFQQGYEIGQQINDAVTPIRNALVDARNRRIERENAKTLEAIDMNRKTKEDYQMLKNEINIKLSDSKYFDQNVIQKIPSLLNNNSSSWETLLNSKEYASAIGKDYLYTTTNFKIQSVSSNAIRKDILDTADPYRRVYSLETFGGYVSRYSYKSHYILGDIQFEGRTVQHDFKFIYNEKNIVIGFYIEFFTTYYKGGYPLYPIEEYYKDILNKIGENYLLLDANTILLKDKLLIIDNYGIEMYDLNLLNDQYIVNWNNYSTTFGYKKLGVGFKQSSVKIVKGMEGTTDKDWKYVFYRTNDKGVIIGSLVEDGLAEKAGLQIDDIISKINGIPVTSPYILQLIVQGYTKDNNFNVSYFRGGVEYKTIINTLEPYISVKSGNYRLNKGEGECKPYANINLKSNEILFNFQNEINVGESTTATFKSLFIGSNKYYYNGDISMAYFEVIDSSKFIYFSKKKKCEYVKVE